jgi:outer membrane protein assembly factor BamB
MVVWGMSRFSFRRLPVAVGTALALLAAGPSLAAGLPRAQHVVIAAAQPQSSPVTTYHNDLYRSGQYVVASLTLKSARRMHLDRSFTGPVNGAVYAQPLYWRARNETGAGEVIAATETNHVTALDAATGAVIWDRVLAPPVQGGTLPCGNIAPEGITGTPVIDPATGSLYVAATALASGGKVVSMVYGLSLKNGHVLPGWPVNVGASLARVHFLPEAQGERGALAFQNGELYVPYGGRYGDCDDYHGTVVAIRTTSPAVAAEWQTDAVRGGIWSVGGVAMADGNLFAVTGNTSGASTWSGGEAIVRLNAALKMRGGARSYFAPSNWQDLDDADKDLGGSNALPVDAGGRKLIVALGKDGNAYLADRLNLGGIGGQLSQTAASTGEIIGGGATWASPGAAFVAFQGNGAARKCSGNNGLTVLRVTGGAKPSISTAWCGGLNGGGDPVVTTSDGNGNRIIWAVGAEGDNRLHGYAAQNGAVVFNGGTANDQMQNVRHMSTILVARGRFYVASDNRIYAFALR